MSRPLSTVSALLHRLQSLREDIAFSRDPELARSLRAADERLHAGDTGGAEDLKRELSADESVETIHS